MLRRLTVAAGVVVTLLHSCTPFGEGADVAPDASGSDGGGGGGGGDGSGGDGGNGGDGGSGPEAGADGMTVADATIDSGPPVPGTCYSLANGPAPFSASGTVTLESGGVKLHIPPSTTTALVHTFPTPTPFTKSTVDMLVRMTFSGTSWGMNYLDLLQLGYGNSVNYISNPVTSLELGGSGVEVNTWYAPNAYDPGSGVMNPALLKPAVSTTADVHFIVTTTWAMAGAVEVTIGGVTSKKSLKTKTTANGNVLTVVIGGTSLSGIPTLDMVVKQVCVTLE